MQKGLESFQTDAYKVNLIEELISRADGISGVSEGVCYGATAELI